MHCGKERRSRYVRASLSRGVGSRATSSQGCAVLYSVRLGGGQEILRGARIHGRVTRSRSSDHRAELRRLYKCRSWREHLEDAGGCERSKSKLPWSQRSRSDVSCVALHGGRLGDRGLPCRVQASISNDSVRIANGDCRFVIGALRLSIDVSSLCPVAKCQSEIGNRKLQISNCRFQSADYCTFKIRIAHQRRVIDGQSTEERKTSRPRSRDHAQDLSLDVHVTPDRR